MAKQLVLLINWTKSTVSVYNGKKDQITFMNAPLQWTDLINVCVLPYTNHHSSTKFWKQCHIFKPQMDGSMMDEKTRWLSVKCIPLSPLVYILYIEINIIWKNASVFDMGLYRSGLQVKQDIHWGCYILIMSFVYINKIYITKCNDRNAIVITSQMWALFDCLLNIFVFLNMNHLPRTFCKLDIIIHYIIIHD